MTLSGWHAGCLPHAVPRNKRNSLFIIYLKLILPELIRLSHLTPTTFTTETMAQVLIRNQAYYNPVEVLPSSLPSYPFGRVLHSPPALNYLPGAAHLHGGVLGAAHACTRLCRMVFAM